MKNIKKVNKLFFEKLVELLKESNLKVTSMESCTGGGFMNYLTNVEGASSITDGGYVTYSNEEKKRRGVPKEIIDKFSVYSSECAKAMAKACKKENKSDISVGITGNFSNIDSQNREYSLPGRVFYCISMPNGYLNRVVEVPIRDKNNISLKRSEQKELVIYSIMKDIEKLTKNFELVPSRAVSFALERKKVSNRTNSFFI